MIFGVCHLSIVPVRENHSDTAEIVTQLIFGEKLSVIDTFKQWRKVKIQHDGYEGWIDEKQFVVISEEEFNTNLEQFIVGVESLKIHSSIGSQTLVRGSILNKIGKDSYGIINKSITFDAPFEMKEKNVSAIAKSYLNAPYLWGGRTPFGIDCSGFTQLVFRFKGIQLKRDASQQVHQGEVISFDRMKEDDVVFFENDKGKITHVGIYLGDGKIIHAHGRVRIDKLTLDGIINGDTNEISHTFHGIRRFD